MMYRWIEDSIQSTEFPDGAVLFLHKGAEFEVPLAGKEWIARAIALGKVEIISEENPDAA